MSIKNSFIRDIKELIANVQPKPDASGYYKYLDTVEADLIATYSPRFDALKTYDGFTIPPVKDNSVLEDMKEKLKKSDDIPNIIGFCKDVVCPEYLVCEDCLFSSYNRSSLIRYLGIDHTEPQVKELPKLTTEVFDRPDCPKWANYAVIDWNGRLTFFANKPKFGGEDYGCWSCEGYGYKNIDNTAFDASDWQNSLIERPKKQEQLPDWVKVGAVGYDDMNNEYFEVIEVNNDSFRAKYIGSSNPCSALYFNEFVSEARKRPFNDKEMKAIVGKNLETPSFVKFIFSYDKEEGTLESHDFLYTADDLFEDDFKFEGKPCYKLEHLNEKGKWVE